MTTIQARQKCGRCQVKLNLDKFKLKRDGTQQKLCIQCNTQQRAYVYIIE